MLELKKTLYQKLKDVNDKINTESDLSKIELLKEYRNSLNDLIAICVERNRF